MHNPKKNNIAFFTVVFPEIEKYLCDFLYSLRNQSNKDFDIIIVNDGLNTFEKYITEFKDLNIIEISHGKSIANNREIGFNEIVNRNYNYVIFGDADDYFSENRVENCIELLKQYDIVVNDLSIVDKKKKLIKNLYYSNRLQDGFLPKIDFIYDKNIFGLSNTAIKVELLKNIDFDDSIIAVDWYLFSILLMNEKTAIFTKEVITYYRQYSENIVGIGKNDVSTIKRGIDIKLNHYKLLSIHGKPYDELYRKFNSLKNSINSDINYFNNYIRKISNKNNNLFWWENIIIPEDI